MPITGIIARPHLWTLELQENPWILGSPTFGGNPLACAAAIAAIKFTIEKDMPAQIKKKGAYFMAKLEKLQKRHPILVDVRGRGLLIGLEYPTPEIGWAVSKPLTLSLLNWMKLCPKWLKNSNLWMLSKGSTCYGPF
jgi:putrescine aminotransferase